MDIARYLAFVKNANREQVYEIRNMMRKDLDLNKKPIKQFLHCKFTL